MNNIINNAENLLDDIDQKIVSTIKENNTPFNEVAIQIIRCAAIEGQSKNKIPKKVLIKEYSDIAASFYNTKTTSFVSGVLDKII